MSNRPFFLTTLLCAAASLIAFGQGNGQEYLFQFSAPPNTFTQAAGYIDSGNLAAPNYNIQGPSGIAAILPTPDGTKFYLIGTAGPTSIESADRNFDASSFHTISGLGASCAAGSAASCGAPTAAAITPDGKYLIVSADELYFIPTSGPSADTVVKALPINGQATFAPNTPGPSVCISCWIAVTGDSQYAFLLTTASGGSVIAKISLTNLAVVSTITLRGTGTSLSISPTGQLYETVEFGIYQIDPNTFSVASGCSNGTSICLNFQPGPLRYTPDGTTAYTVNLNSSTGGGALAQVNLSSGSVFYWNPQNAPQLTDILVASNSRIFAYSTNLGALYDVSTNPLAATVAAPSLVTSSSGILDIVVRNEIVAAAISNEIPSANWLFLLVANGQQPDLYRVDLTKNALSSNTLSTFNGGVMETTYQPATSGASQFVQFNNNQTITANGMTSLPLIAQVLTAQGLPVFGQSATFTTDSSTGLVINTPTATTNAQGFVRTTVSVPTAGAACASGICTVTLTVGGASTTFTVTVPASNTGGGNNGGNGGNGGNNTSSQMTIISGDGQLIPSGFGNVPTLPLTVMVTDANGKPLPNQTVNFTTTGAPLILSATTQTTDQNGLASIGVISPAIAPGFQQATVTATSAVGSVTFTETVYYLLSGLEAPPTVQLIAPSTCCSVNVTAGTPLTAGIQAQVIWNGDECPNGGSGCPIPGVGIQIYDPDNTPTAGNYTSSGTQPVVKCQGSSDSNSLGVASCNVVAAVCPAGGQPISKGIVIVVGNIINSYNYTATVSPGGANALSIVSGNNQIGNTGAAVKNPLVVQVVDACGNPLPAQQVSWKVTQGSATVQNATVNTGPNGQASDAVTFGQTAGTVIITASLANGSSVKFTLTSQAVATSLVLTSGGGQTGTTGQAFANPLIFTLTDKSNNPVAGATVNFIVTTGSATLSPTSATTNASGQVQTTVTAGATAGQIIITASGAGLTATAQLVAQLPGPTLTPSSFQNAASFQPGLVPCGLAIVTGSGIAPTPNSLFTGPTFGPLPYSMGPINSLTIGGIAAPISSVSNENGIQQATFQTPCEVPTASGTTTVAITVNGVTTQVSGVQVLPSQPGIFTYSGPNNIPYAAVIGSDSLYVTPSHPAVRGQLYYLIVTGLGQTAPAASTDNPGSGQAVNQYVIVGVNNAGVPVGTPIYASGLIGAYLIPFTIPATASPGTNVPLSVGTLPLVNGQPSTTATPVYSNLTYLPQIQ